MSYERFISRVPQVLIPLCVYLRSCLGQCSGVSFIDSTRLAVCHNRRIKQHKVFANLAALGKTSVDWFFGFKLHLVINHQGEILNFTLTPGNIDDRVPVPQLLQSLFGEVFGDKGYLSKQLGQQLFEQSGIQFITKLRRNMKNRLMKLRHRLLLRKRSLIETVFGEIKDYAIEHSRHRSPINYLVNLVSGLIAYCHKPNKPSIAIDLPSAYP